MLFRSEKEEIMNRKRVFVIIAEVVPLLMLAALVIYLIVRWNSIPDTIPFHFNAAGTADSWRGKKSIITEPVIAGFVYLLLTWISSMMNPNESNNITEALSRTIKLMFRILKIEAMCLIWYITYCEAEAISSGTAYIYIFVGVIMVTSIGFSIKAVMQKLR